MLQQLNRLSKVVSASLAIVGVIHLLPLIGVLGADRLASLYGVAVDDVNLAILMRHRAVLFGLLGTFLVYAAFRPALQVMAIAAGLVSVASFNLLALTTGGYSDAIGRVVTADWIALACLLVGVVALALARREG